MSLTSICFMSLFLYLIHYKYVLLHKYLTFKGTDAAVAAKAAGYEPFLNIFTKSTLTNTALTNTTLNQYFPIRIQTKRVILIDLIC